MIGQDHLKFVSCPIFILTVIYHCIRAAAVRLQRAQSKLEAISRTAHREISTLLHQESRSRLIQPDAAQATLATVRQKAEKLLAEDIAGEIMAILEHYCDILLETKLPKK